VQKLNAIRSTCKRRFTKSFSLMSGRLRVMYFCDNPCPLPLMSRLLVSQ